MDKIIGKDYPFIIHKMQTGENLSQFAYKYQTSIEAIIRVNYSLNIPVWVGALVVIPVGFTDVAQMPYFQPYSVTTGGITVEALANELSTNLNNFKIYNDIKTGERFNMGDWVLIPRSQAAS
jgi:LysM repeat protein